MDPVSQSFYDVMEAFNTRMTAFESDLKSSSPSSNTETLSADFQSFKSFALKALKALQSQINILASDADQREMRSRSKILLVHGVPEQKNEDTAAVVVKNLSGKLKLPEFAVTCISRCHRMGRNVSVDKPRPILLKLRDLTLRDKLWFAKVNLKSTGITLSEFLTKSRHETFMSARQRFGITKCWTRNGFIHILGPDGKRYRISSVKELQNIAAPPVPKSDVSKPEPAQTSAACAAKDVRASKSNKRAASACRTKK